MSKKKSTIMDDDPLAWLKNESTVEDSEVEVQALDAVVEQTPVESIATEVPIESKQESNKKSDSKAEESHSDEASAEQNLVKEKTIDADSNEEVMLVSAAIDSETEAETESQNAGNENLQVSVIEKDAQQLSENNEEDVAMATSNSEKIVLEEDVSIVQVAILKEAWLPVLDSGKDITIDASAVEDIDTAGLQLLLSLVKTAKDSGRSVTWDGPSEAVINAVKETSLRDALGIQL